MFTDQMRRIVDHFGISEVEEHVEQKVRKFVTDSLNYIEKESVKFTPNLLDLARGIVTLGEDAKKFEEDFKSEIEALASIAFDKHNLYHLAVCYINYFVINGREKTLNALEHEKKVLEEKSNENLEINNETN